MIWKSSHRRLKFEILNVPDREEKLEVEGFLQQSLRPASLLCQGVVFLRIILAVVSTNYVQLLSLSESPCLAYAQELQVYAYLSCIFDNAPSPSFMGVSCPAEITHHRI